MTPERRINDIFQAVQELLSPSRELVPFLAPNAFTMSLKSSLEYKYRPTVKYEVELFRSADENSIGELTVIFRTQSSALIEAMAEFFRLWKRIEDAHLAPLIGRRLQYALYDGRFVRSIALPDGRDVTTDEVARSISEYIKMFDGLMKGYLAGRLSAQDVESEYYSRIGGWGLLI